MGKTLPWSIGINDLKKNEITLVSLIHE
jgi:hypothetical protein